MNSWRGFNVFTNGITPNPTTLWCIVAPVGSGGLLHNLQGYMIDKLTQQGIFVIGIHFAGCDGGEDAYGAWYFNIGAWILDVKAEYGLTTNPVLYAQSRGGLELLNFAGEAPSLVTRIACLYPVTDPAVWPTLSSGINAAHNKSPDEFGAILQSGPYAGHPVVTRYTPNAKAAALDGVPICIWHGDSDTTVPKTLTTDIFAPLCHAWVKTLTGYGHVTPLQSWQDEIVYYIQWSVPPSGAVQQ